MFSPYIMSSMIIWPPILGGPYLKVLISISSNRRSQVHLCCIKLTLTMSQQSANYTLL